MLLALMMIHRHYTPPSLILYIKLEIKSSCFEKNVIILQKSKKLHLTQGELLTEN